MLKLHKFVALIVILAGFCATTLSADSWRDRNGYRRGSYGDDYYVKERSAGASAGIIAGSAGAGAAIGAIAGGGKGAAIGALVGGAGGLIYDRATKNKKVYRDDYRYRDSYRDRNYRRSFGYR